MVRYRVARSRDNFWHSRAIATIIVFISIVLVILESNFPGGIGTVLFLLIGLTTPTRFLIGILLLSFGLYIATPSDFSTISLINGLLLVGMVAIGFAMLWWDWQTARSSRPIVATVSVPDEPSKPVPEWQRQLAGVIGVWWAAIFGAILIALYLVFGSLDSS